MLWSNKPSAFQLIINYKIMKKKCLLVPFHGEIFKKLWRIMKITLLLMIIGVFTVSAKVFSQDCTISVKMQNGSLTDLFKVIEQKTEYRVFYKTKLVEDAERLNINVTQEPLSDLLTNLLSERSLSYDLIDKVIVITPSSDIRDPQQKKNTITGKITDNSGVPMTGVTVKVKDKSNVGTVTDINGKFTIIVPEGGSVLVISYVGYKTQEISIAGKSSINIKLEEDVSKLEEIVIVGYGSQRKRDVTSAISTINVSNLKDIPASSPTKLLVGQALGVTVHQPVGNPGRELDVVIRGLGSLGAGSQPLYVIDGFPIGTSIGQNLNPNDIATISVLKDAVSTSIYGARGSNGVILITTKNAKAGEVSVKVTANYGIQNIPDSRKTKVLNGVEYAQYLKDAFMDKIRYYQNREPDISEVPLNFRYPEQTAVSTNWYDAVLHKNAPYQNYNVTLSQGKGDMHSLFSVGYVGQEGQIIKTNYKLFSARANIDGQINKFINMGMNITGSFSNQNLATTEGGFGITGQSSLMDPRESIYNADGTYRSYIGGHDGIYGFPNPVQMLNEMTMNRVIGDVLSNGFVEISFLKNFKFKSAVNARLNVNSYKSFTPSTISAVNGPAPRNAAESDDAYKTMNLSADQLLTYANKFGNHSLNVLVGHTAQLEIVKGVSASGSQFSSDLTPFLGSAALKSAGSTENGWSMDAYFSRVNYSFKDKYLFSATLRREGSSRFGVKNKFGNFPAVSAGWRISDESFMPKHSWLTDLKIRASYGITGNNNIGNYSSLAFMNSNNYILGGTFAAGSIIGSFSNAGLGWERSNQLDIGLDFAAFDNKLTFIAEYYNKITNDMLLSIQVPANSGFTTSLGNGGKVQNYGLEFAVGYKTKINELGFFSNFNISFNRNKVLGIYGSPNDAIWSGHFVSKVGQPISMLYGYKVLGIFQNQAEINSSPKQDGAVPGSYKMQDTNGDGIVTYDTKDYVPIGNPWPKATWGLALGGDYKNFDLNILFTGEQKYDIYRGIESNTMNMDGIFNVLTESKYRWRSEQNPGNGKYATTNFWKWERESSSRYIYDASHIWIRNISLGYTIPKSKSHFNSVRIYLSADNVYLFTSFPGNNPEVNYYGIKYTGNDEEAYPVARTFSIGANLTF